MKFVRRGVDREWCLDWWDEKGGGSLGEIRSIKERGDGVVSRDYFGGCVFVEVGKYGKSVIYLLRL